MAIHPIVAELPGSATDSVASGGPPSGATEFGAAAILATLTWFAIRMAHPRIAKMLDDREARLRIADSERLERLKSLKAEVKQLRASEMASRLELARCEPARDIARAALESAKADALLHSTLADERLETNDRLSREVEELKRELLSARSQNEEPRAGN